jgi:protein disulfide-isomerase
MKKSLMILFSFVAFGALAVAADGTWLTNYDEALAKAKAEGKVLLVEFHGSDWCPPCIKLNAEVLSKEAFKTFAQDELVLLNVDFPRRTPLSDEQRSHNEALAEKFGLQGVPMVLLIDGEGTVLDKMVGFPQGGLDGFMAFVKAKTGE